MPRYIADKDGHWVLKESTVSEGHFVQPDLEEFRSTDGAWISGKRQWREHLKMTNAVELGHADLAAAKEKWESRKSSHAARIKGGQVVDPGPLPEHIPESPRSRVNAEVANRLYNRPAPDRKTLLKITLETARDLARRR